MIGVWCASVALYSPQRHAIGALITTLLSKRVLQSDSNYFPGPHTTTTRQQGVPSSFDVCTHLSWLVLVRGRVVMMVMTMAMLYLIVTFDKSMMPLQEER